MIDFINEYRAIHGVEPICRVLPIARSTYYAHAARHADPGKLPARAQRDAAPKIEIGRVYDENFRVYGVRKVWRQLGREGIAVARCTVARLMRTMGLQGVVRGKRVRTTISNAAALCPHRSRQSAVQGTAPECPVGVRLYLRRDVGWLCPCCLCHRRLCQAHCRLACLSHGSRRLCAGRAGAGPARAPVRPRRRPRPPQRSRCAVRLDQIYRAASAAGIEPSVGSVGDSYDNASPRPSSLQSRGDPSPRPLAQLRSGRVRHPRMGQLVQQPPPSRANRKPPSRRGRGRLLRPAGADRIAA